MQTFLKLPDPQRFPSMLSSVQALDLLSTVKVEEGIFISKDERAGTVAILSLVSWGLET